MISIRWTIYFPLKTLPSWRKSRCTAATLKVEGATKFFVFLDYSDFLKFSKIQKSSEKSRKSRKFEKYQKNREKARKMRKFKKIRENQEFRGNLTQLDAIWSLFCGTLNFWGCGSISGFSPRRRGVKKKISSPSDRARRVLSWSTLRPLWFASWANR